MNNFVLHVPGLGIEAFNAIKPVAEIGSINFVLYTIRTEKTGAELSAVILHCRDINADQQPIPDDGLHARP